MERKTTTFFSIIIISLIISAYIIATYKPEQKQPTLQPTQQHTQAQIFLTNVIGLDTTKYTLTLLPTKEIPNLPTEYDPNNQEYQVETNINQFKATIKYENNKLTRCRLRWLTEPTNLANYSPDPLEIVRDFILKYKEFTQEDYLIEIQHMLDQITTTEPIAIVSDSGEVIFDVIYRESYLYFHWSKTVDGIANEFNQVSIILRDNLLATFSDTWNERIVSDVSIISREEAISIAKQHVKNYSYIFANTKVSDFSILEKPLRVELSMQIKDETTVSPLYYIRFGLSEVYPGVVTEIRVSLWADTGELVWINHAGP